MVSLVNTYLVLVPIFSILKGSFMLTTGNQLKAARALAEMEQKELAEAAKVNVNTIRSMEASGSGPISGRAQNVQTVQRVLEEAGIEFLNHGQPGVRLRLPKG
jgi:hypothetical protein